MRKLRAKLRFLRRMWSLRETSRSSCANRYTVHGKLGDRDVKIIIRNPGAPDGYSREELLKMLWTIRKHEKQQEWSVPEPTDADLQATYWQYEIY